MGKSMKTRNLPPVSGGFPAWVPAALKGLIFRDF